MTVVALQAAGRTRASRSVARSTRAAPTPTRAPTGCSSPRRTSRTAPSSSTAPTWRWSPTSSSTIPTSSPTDEAVRRRSSGSSTGARRCTGDPVPRRPRRRAALADRIDGPVITYGTDPRADVRLVVDGDDGTTGSAVDGEELATLELGVPGRHNLLNATAALAVCAGSASTCEAAAAGSGVHGRARRFQRLGEAGASAVVDDYAHHPTELRATLAAARSPHRSGSCSSSSPTATRAPRCSAPSSGAPRPRRTSWSSPTSTPRARPGPRRHRRIVADAAEPRARRSSTSRTSATSSTTLVELVRPATWC
jgi:hypothetical protein